MFQVVQADNWQCCESVFLVVHMFKGMVVSPCHTRLSYTQVKIVLTINNIFKLQNFVQWEFLL